MRALADTSRAEDLSGTFARLAISATIVNTVVSGYQTGGGENWLLSRRTWNDDEQLRNETGLIGAHAVVGGRDSGDGLSISIAFRLGGDHRGGRYLTLTLLRRNWYRHGACFGIPIRL